MPACDQGVQQPHVRGAGSAISPARRRRNGPTRQVINSAVPAHPPSSTPCKPAALSTRRHSLPTGSSFIDTCAISGNEAVFPQHSRARSRRRGAGASEDMGNRMGSAWCNGPMSKALKQVEDRGGKTTDTRTVCIILICADRPALHDPARGSK
jgi:hypothetical protein